MGTFELQAKVGKLVAPKQKIEVGEDGYEGTVYLGEASWSFYRLGQHAIPFPPQHGIVAITPRQGIKVKAISTTLNKIIKLAQLIPSEFDSVDIDSRSERGAIRLYKTESRSTFQDLYDKLRKSAGSVARVGLPVDVRPGHTKMIDADFVVRFRESVKPNEAEQRIRMAGADIVRSLFQSPNTWLIRFRSGDPLENLATIESWHEEGILIFGEPDLVAEISDDVFPYNPPDDPTYGSQLNLTLQRVDTAWRLLADIDPKLTTGSPHVYVASLDRGIDMDHPDLGGHLTDGSEQLSRTFDFSGMRECTVAGYAPDTDHGMGVYGIIAASADNAEDIAGIAPNTHHIGLERPGLTTAEYADVLLWAAGFVTNNTNANWPNEPLSPAADIISCSHGSSGTALSGTMDATFKMLASQGRNGLGTVVIYSAGNDNRSITGYRTWAAHPDTIAVSNSLQPDANGVERKDGTSNYGPEIDVCAQGTGAPSLNMTGGEQVFGGTSAAAPTVAGVVALMLSVEPTLTLKQVRGILRETAVKIDPNCNNANGKWNNGFSQWYGYGRIDAASAVERAKFERGDITTDFNGDGTSDIPVTSPWGIGILSRQAGALTSLAMAKNGSRLNGWVIDTENNRFDIMADLDGDGESEILVTSSWGIGVLERSGSGYRGVMLERNGSRFGSWLLNTRDNRFGPVGNFAAGVSREIIVTSPWGIGVLRLQGTTFSNPLIKSNGTRFGGWLLNTDDNRFGPIGDFDGDGRQEILITSLWGIGILKMSGSTFSNPLIKPNGTRFDGWLLNTHDNHFGPIGDFDGDGTDEIMVRSPWGIGILKLSGNTFSAIAMKPNGTRFNGWLLNTHDNRFWAAADFDGDNVDEIFISSPWGIGILERSGNSFKCTAMKPNGTRFNGWLLNTHDNNFKGFTDLTGNGRADILVTSPWGLGFLAQNGTSFSASFVEPNGSRFGGWLLSTADNKFY
jgi:subtilisin family serine protease